MTYHKKLVGPAKLVPHVLQLGCCDGLPEFTKNLLYCQYSKRLAIIPVAMGALGHAQSAAAVATGRELREL
jgi:hypothetical protein